jgi:cell fate regulator YaaT (PSP1 superfamily)
MACTNCSTNNGGIPAGCNNNGNCSSGGCDKLDVYDWLANMDLPASADYDLAEIRFKNGRKGFYRNVHKLPLYTGDAVAVEASPGYDVGIITLTGELVRIQMNKKEIGTDSQEIKKIFRKAKPEDLDKWKEARAVEFETMHRARKMALDLKLEMKISDVEYQGDKTKAIFYYTAEGRVDFRELIKVMADQFKIRIEMRQIGARQEAGRLGGIGSCGRELCCSTWLTDFRTVSTSAARYQQLSLNPQKLAGQCGKLKCCLNYELDMYVEAYKDFPDNNIKLETQKGRAHHQKTDTFKRMMWYTVEGDPTNNFIGLKIDRVKEIIALNKKGVIVESLDGFVEKTTVEKQPDYDNVVGQDSLTRFDKPKHNKNKGKWQGNNKNQEQRTENQDKGQQQKKWQGNKENREPRTENQDKGQHQKKWQGNKENRETGTGNQGNNQNQEPKTENQDNNNKKPQHKHHHKPNPNRNQQGQNKKWQGNKPNNPNQGNNTK